MSSRWDVTKAVRASGLPAPARLLMLVLADVAEVGTAEVPEQFTPSLRVLAAETGLNESTVKRHLTQLEADGWIERIRPSVEDARFKAARTRYRLHAVGAQSTHGGAEEAQTGAQKEPTQGAEEAHPGRTERPLNKDFRSTSDPSFPRKRGTRIPDDFTVTSAMREWAMANVPELAGSRETEKFINYWQAKSGRDACKLDWIKTWKNWMLTAAERRAPPRTAPASTAPTAVPLERRCPEHPHNDADTCRDCAARRRARKEPR